MDRDLAMHLTQATADDDTSVDDALMKAVIKGCFKARDDASVEIVATLTQKLNEGGFKVKLKTLRITMMILNDKKKSQRIRAAAVAGGLPGAIESLITFECPPDPTHGDKPQQMVRTSAQRCFGMLDADDAAAAGSSGGSFADRARAKAAQAQQKMTEAADSAKLAAATAQEQAQARMEQAQSGGASPKVQGGPAAPSTPVETGSTVDSITMSWTMPERGPGLTFGVQTGGRIGGWKQVDDAITAGDGSPPQWSCTAHNLASNSLHFFRVRAKTSTGWGEWSAKSAGVSTAKSAAADVGEPGPAPAPAPAPADPERTSLLFQSVTEGDSKAPDELVKAIVTLAVKGSPADVDALIADFATLFDSDKVTVLIKSLRMAMTCASNKRSGNFKQKLGEATSVRLTELVEFVTEPDAQHGEKPQQMVRAAAGRCLKMLDIAPVSAPAPAPAPAAAPATIVVIIV